jgi:hypothetical protein
MFGRLGLPQLFFALAAVLLIWAYYQRPQP